MSQLSDSTFRNAVPHLPNSPGRGSGPVESVTTSHGILSPDLPICSMDQAWPHITVKSWMRSPTQGDAASPWGKAGWSRVQEALIWSGLRGDSYFWPPSSHTERQQEPQAPKHMLCNARAAGRAAGMRQTNPDFGDHSFIAVTATPGQGPDLVPSTQTHREPGPGCGETTRNTGCPGQAGGRLLSPPVQPARCRGREETLYAGEASGGQRRTGDELAGRHLCPCTPARALRGAQTSGVPEAGEDKGLTPPTKPASPTPSGA